MHIKNKLKYITKNCTALCIVPLTYILCYLHHSQESLNDSIIILELPISRKIKYFNKKKYKYHKINELVTSESLKQFSTNTNCSSTRPNNTSIQCYRPTITVQQLHWYIMKTSYMHTSANIILSRGLVVCKW